MSTAPVAITTESIGEKPPAALVRTVLPLALVTCTSMLAMDLYLPAVPALQKSFDADVSLAQASIAIFLAGHAASQFLWAEAFNRLGPKRVVMTGVVTLFIAAICGALAPTIGFLLGVRLIQGIAAGAALVVAPSVVRATLPGAEAVRGIAAISMAEAVIPAAGPVAGALLLAHMDWRGIFWVLGALTLIALPFAVRATPKELPGLDRTINASYAAILANRRFRRLALSHALSFGALIAFVASGPQLAIHALGQGVSAFATLQVIGVAAFILVASQSGRICRHLGTAGAIQLGAWLQAAICAVMLSSLAIVQPSLTAVAVFWASFCASLAVRGPPSFSEALSLPPAQMGRASAMMTLAFLAAGAAGTQLVAPYMDEPSMVPLAVTMLAFVIASLLLVLPYASGRAILANDGGHDQ